MQPTEVHRDIRLDALRIVAAFAVVWLHVSGEVVANNPDVHSRWWWVGNVADAASRWCVPIFVMISGALLLSRPSEAEPLKFYRRRTARLLVPMVFWTIFYIGFGAYRVHAFDPMMTLRNLVQGIPAAHLWYLYMLFGLTLFTPFVRQLVAASTLKLLRIFIILSFLVASIEAMASTLMEKGPATFLGRFPFFVAYFVTGYYLHSLSEPKAVPMRALIVAVITCTALISLSTGLLLPLLGTKSWDLMYGYLNPLVIVMSLFVYRFAIGLRPLSGAAQQGMAFKMTRRIAQVTLGIYVIHPFWMAVLASKGINGFFIHPVFGIPVTALSAFGLSLLTAALLSTIPFVRATVQ